MDVLLFIHKQKKFQDTAGDRKTKGSRIRGLKGSSGKIENRENREISSQNKNRRLEMGNEIS